MQRNWPIAFFLFTTLTLTSCSEEKARSLQAASLQFRTESLAAIDAIDNLRKRELEPAPRSATEVRQSFVNRLLNSKSELNGDLIDLAIDPFRAPKVEEWDNFVKDLKSQYAGFSAIFAQLEGGTLVGVGEVKKSAEYAKTLTVQMALLSDAIAANPPVFTQSRSRVVIRLKQVRQDYQTTQAKLQAREAGATTAETLPQLTNRRQDLENQAAELMGQWQQIKLDEQQLLEATVTQCTRAVTIGKELIELANHYDDINLQQFNLTLPRIFATANQLTGRNYSAVQGQSDRLLKDLQTDPFWRTVTQQVLDRANNAAASRSRPKP
jgi:hypothetical protein